MFETSLSREASRKALFAIAVFSWLAVAFALVSQHKFDMQPCAWCIFQRILYVVIGAAALLCLGLMSLQSARVRERTQKTGLWLALVIAMSGLGIALYQFFVASKVQSCVHTWAQKFLNGTGIDQFAPDVFMATASCADAAQAKLLGVPYEMASALGFTSLAAIALYALLKR